MEDSSTSATSPDDSSPVLSPAYDQPVLDPVAPPSPESPVGLELRHSTRLAFLPLILLIITALLLLPPSMNLTPIVRPILTLFGSKL